MSAEQIMASMLGGGVAVGVSATTDVQTIMQTQTELNSIIGRRQEIMLSIEKDNQEAARQIAAIDAKYAAQIDAIPRSEWHSGLGSGTAQYVHNEAESKQRDALAKTCRTEQFTLWRNHVATTQQRIISEMMADVPRYDELMKQHMTATGMTGTAQHNPSAGYDVAIEYLDAARSVTNLPGIEYSGLKKY
jgi:hypothetical protein